MELQQKLTELSELERVTLNAINTYTRVVATVPEVDAGKDALAALATYAVHLVSVRGALVQQYAVSLVPQPAPSEPSE